MKEVTTEELKQIQIDILKDVHRFCLENNIYYSISYGTLIGAVRHNGYIPWDDDIDITMPRPDYERFINEYVSENQRYEVLSFEKDKTWIYPYAKVMDTQTLLVENVKHHYKNLGINIDVFPIDGFEQKVTDKQIRLEKFRMFKFARCDFHIHTIKELAFVVLKILLCVIPLKAIVSAMCKNTKKINYTTADLVMEISSGYKSKPISKKVFDDKVLLDFEDSKFYAMSGFDQYLRSYYGDYMQLPPENERVTHHSYIAYFK